MQDRFKFRCFNPDDKTMHYTDFIVTATGFISRLEAMENNNRIFYIDSQNLDIDKKLKLMQCTGLKDKNGKLIYEGDIVKRIKVGGSVLPEVEYIGIVTWQKFGGGGYYLEVKGSKVGHNLPSGNQSEIIGNIYETPELLEADNE